MFAKWKGRNSYFIEIDYTGKLTDNRIFDTSIREIGENNHIHKHNYEPLIVIVGENNVIKGLDKNLEGTGSARACGRAWPAR